MKKIVIISMFIASNAFAEDNFEILFEDKNSFSGTTSVIYHSKTNGNGLEICTLNYNSPSSTAPYLGDNSSILAINNVNNEVGFALMNDGDYSNTDTIVFEYNGEKMELSKYIVTANDKKLKVTFGYNGKTPDKMANFLYGSLGKLGGTVMIYKGLKGVRIKADYNRDGIRVFDNCIKHVFKL